MRTLVSPKLSNFASFPRVSVLRTLTFYSLFQFGEQWCNEIGQLLHEKIFCWDVWSCSCAELALCPLDALNRVLHYIWSSLLLLFFYVSLFWMCLFHLCYWGFCKICQVFALKIYLLCCTARQPISCWLLSKWVKPFRCSFISTNPIYGGLTEWESNIFTMLRLLLMCKVMESRIHGVTILDFAKLRVI